ncbi:MAG: 2-amino-4-hydroxy-6-hydroxymethyldihydropteridine diphosphokinase [Verrucomicrobia bacterium]|nr:2-amino-4-hydroxy-6-hydroxymethyldihydropteridine diphosphokinase [Verrucomicrobiota bacterium]
MRVGIGLGSNVGDCAAELAKAREWLRGLDAGMRVSSEYETEAVGCVCGTPVFRNQAVEICWRGSLESLLGGLQDYERSRGRQTVRKVNEPRTVDLDLLYADECRVKTARLELPHPRMAERRFVMEPLAEICPGRRISGLPGTVLETAVWLRKKGGSACRRIA